MQIRKGIAQIYFLNPSDVNVAYTTYQGHNIGTGPLYFRKVFNNSDPAVNGKKDEPKESMDVEKIGSDQDEWKEAISQIKITS